MDSTITTENSMYFQYIEKVGENKYWHAYFEIYTDLNELHVVTNENGKFKTDSKKYEDCKDFFAVFSDDFLPSKAYYLGDEKLGLLTYRIMFIFDFKNKRVDTLDYYKIGLDDTKDISVFINEISREIYLFSQPDERHLKNVYHLNQGNVRLEKTTFQTNFVNSLRGLFTLNRDEILVSFKNGNNSSFFIYNTKTNKETKEIKLPQFYSNTKYGYFKYDSTAKVLWTTCSYNDENGKYVSLLMYSKDFGITWKKSFNSNSLPKGTVLGNDLRFFSFAGNTIVAFFHIIDSYITSDDYGKTWTYHNYKTVSNVFALIDYEEVDKGNYLISIWYNRLMNCKIKDYTDFDSTNIKDTPGDTLLNSVEQNVYLAEYNSEIIVNQLGNNFELFSKSDFIGLQKVEIFNINGVLIQEFQFPKIVQNQLQKFQLNLGDGVYFLKISENENIYTKKFTSIN